MLSFQSAINIREILVCATLAERPVKIECQSNPGPHLQTFLRLLQIIQTGCKIEVTTKGVTYIPGIITNQDGKTLQYDCTKNGQNRSLSYFIEPLLILSVFGKAPLRIELQGSTSDSLDMSIDTLMNAYLPLLKKFNPESDAAIKILRRGTSGLVLLTAKPTKQLRNIELIERGPIKRIRGVCYGVKVAPNLLNRVVTSARNVFNDYIPDVWINTDLQKNQKGIELNSDYGVSLVGESINDCLISVDAEFNEQFNTPELVGEEAALRLLDEVKHSGCVDSSLQQYCLLLMAVSQKKLSRVRLGRISTQTVETLRIIKQILGVTFNIEDQIFSCFGCGLVNISRQTV